MRKGCNHSSSLTTRPATCRRKPENVNMKTDSHQPETVNEAPAQGTLAAPTGSAIPRALFSCSNTYCAEEVSHHADDLYWYAAEQRWVCEQCWDNLPAPTDEAGNPTRGITLAEYIIGRQLPAVALLQNVKSSRDAGRKE